MHNLPRFSFAHLPTPIEAMPRLSARLPGKITLWVKRDDQTGLAFGGNKTRKLEFLVAEAVAQGAKRLVSAGAAQSNHCRQTAAAAARYGLACTLVLTGAPEERPSANLLLDQLFGAEIIWVADRAERDRVLRESVQHLEDAGERPYLVPYGGSSPTGAAGYFFAMQEFLAQENPATWIVFASSSGGTQAGLALGAKHFGFAGQVLGISIDEPADRLRAHVAELANQTAAQLGISTRLTPQEILVEDRFAAPGYGVFTELEREAITLFARNEGLLLDPVYTGRAAGGLLALIREGRFPTDTHVLFWHTGGTPGLFADRYAPHLLETV